MKIWKLRCASNDYASLLGIENVYSFDEIRSFNGRSLINEWKPIKVERIRSKEDECKMLGDSPFAVQVGGLPVLSKRAVNVLEPILKGHAEFLPLICKEGDFYAVNVTTVLNATNWEKAKAIPFKKTNTNKIMRFEKYAFLPEIVKDIPIFRLQDEILRLPFISNWVADTIDAFQLRIAKILVWDSEHEGDNSLYPVYPY